MHKVYLISDHTGLTVEAIAHSLLSQFADMDFNISTARYIDSESELSHLLASIKANVGDQEILLFTTLVDPSLKRLLQESGLAYIDLFEQMLPVVSRLLDTPYQAVTGQHHAVHHAGQYQSRIQAINYTLSHDDGGRTEDYAEADIVLLGVSRSGKTPVSLYLSMQFGLKVANYPFDEEELASGEMPRCLARVNKQQLFGLVIEAERLHDLRSARMPDSVYASLPQCQWETRHAAIWYQDYIIPFLDITDLSVEEAATRILHNREQSVFR